MLFFEPSWLSILILISFSMVLLVAALANDRLGRGGFDTAPLLSLAGLAVAYVLGGAWCAGVLVAFVLVTHGIARAIERAVARQKTDASIGLTSAGAWLLTALIVNVAVVAAISRLVINEPLHGVASAFVPVGVSYFAFHGISYVVDVYRRRAAAETSPWRLGVHLVLVPQIVGGPLAYDEMMRPLARRVPNVSDYSYGARRLLIGVWKVFVIGALAGAQADAVFALRPAALSTSRAWLGLAGLTVQIYYVFSGYSDMGIGLGRMLGFRLPENFRWPYVGETVRGFWLRWHVGLSAWFRDYAIPSTHGNAGATHESPLRTSDRAAAVSAAREALVVLLCGIWYGVGWTFVAWAVYHAALILLERLGLEDVVKRAPAPLRHVYLVVIVMAGWVILRSDTVGSAWVFFTALAGLHEPTVLARPRIALETWIVLAAGAVGCAPLFPTIRRWTVAIDALIVSLLMMLFAAFLFVWRCGRMVVAPVLRFAGR